MRYSRPDSSRSRPYPGAPAGRFPAIALIAVAVTLLAAPGISRGGGLDDITICHGFGCRIQESISISGEEWSQVKAFFRQPAETPADEREQIRKATGWFEVIAGRHSPIHLDKGRNEIPGRFGSVRRGPDAPLQAASTAGQMDCIDESLNVTTFLARMEQAGLFRHHRVTERAHRRSALDQHYAGQIEEIESGTRWVVDSWFYDYGSLPYVEEATEWHDIPFLFSTSFPEAADG